MLVVGCWLCMYLCMLDVKICLGQGVETISCTSTMQKILFMK